MAQKLLYSLTDNKSKGVDMTDRKTPVINDNIEQSQFGLLTPDGDIHEFKRGIERIIKDSPVPVIPTALRGLWGSFFSRKDNKAMRRLPRGFRSKIEFVVGEPMDPDSVTAEKLEETVKKLRSNKP